MTLKGRALFITGASRGIGLAIALRAAPDGAYSMSKYDMSLQVLDSSFRVNSSRRDFEADVIECRWHGIKRARSRIGKHDGDSGAQARHEWTIRFQGTSALIVVIVRRIL